MQIEHLYYFLDLVETESVTASSKRLYISQQGLSKSLQNLEKEFDLPLFAHYGNRLFVTDVGLDFAKTVRELLNIYQKLRKKTVEYRSKNGGDENQTVFATPYLVRNFFPLFEGIVESKCQELEISLIEKPSFEMNDNPGGVFAVVDCVCLASVITQDSCELAGSFGVVFDPICEYKTFVKMASDSYFATKESFSAEDLSKLPLITFDDNLLTAWLFKMTKPFGEPNILLSTRSRDELNSVLRKSKMLSFVNEIAWRYKQERDLTVRPIDNVPIITLGALYRKNAVISAKVMEFLAFLRCLTA